MAMSGVKINTDVVEKYNKELKMNPKISCMFLKLSESGKEVVLEKEYGVNELPFEELVKVIPEQECRFIIYDHEYLDRSDEQNPVNKKGLIYISWIPDNAAIKSKMVYASTNEYVKKSFNGVKHYVQANDLSDLAKQPIDDKLSKSTGN